MKEQIFLDEVQVGSQKFLENLFKTFSKTVSASSPKVIRNESGENIWIKDFK